MFVGHLFGCGSVDLINFKISLTASSLHLCLKTIEPKLSENVLTLQFELRYISETVFSSISVTSLLDSKLLFFLENEESKKLKSTLSTFSFKVLTSSFIAKLLSLLVSISF
jgi:hypothetical protein